MTSESWIEYGVRRAGDDGVVNYGRNKHGACEDAAWHNEPISPPPGEPKRWWRLPKRRSPEDEPWFGLSWNEWHNLPPAVVYQRTVTAEPWRQCDAANPGGRS